MSIEGFSSDMVSIILFNKKTRYREVYGNNMMLLKSIHSKKTSFIIGDDLYNIETDKGSFIKIRNGFYVNVNHITEMLVMKGRSDKASLIVGLGSQKKTVRISRRSIGVVKKAILKKTIPINKVEVF